MNTPFDDTLQSLFDSSLSAMPETPTFGQDFHTSSPFDDSHSFAQTYQADHFSQENHWDNSAFHSAPEHSLNQQIDSLLNGSDSSDDSNNLNATNFTMPTFQHLPHYHPSHDHFHTPHLLGKEYESHVASSESYTFHSASDANPYTTVESDGHIYKHVGSDTDWIATVHDRKVYNLHEDYLGRAGTDGNVYDKHDNVIGTVDNQGHVYDSVGHHVCNTTYGVVGGAAYLLTVYNGNVS
ncbi:MAG: hypothetical protein BWK78_07810 [Thiotrichaceae bacterium IS1]|nr:MAG: hypothetical protein BWK78_07810 [Thiotrichaceae bacterium IS1]